ncbi:hypothetical protein [Flavobacterium sp.]|uniref:hypothetical protein n=1 Tax=Flavobacterium sp. TaxID=239 RepID=UPI0037520B46
MTTFLFVLFAFVIIFIITSIYRKRLSESKLTPEEINYKVKPIGKIFLAFLIIGIIAINFSGYFPTEEEKELKKQELIAKNSIEYELKPGAVKFNEFIKDKKDSLALAQAIYLAETYADDGITHYANNIKIYLKNKGYDYDSIQKDSNDILETKNSSSSISSNYSSSYINSTDDANPCVMSEDFIKKDLYNPTTADFSMFDCSTERNSDGTYTILRKISAKNSLGVEKEYIYKLKLGFKGGNWVDISNWDLINMRSEEYR